MGAKLIDYKGVPNEQLERKHPCIENISKKTKKSIDTLVNRYIKFLDKARISSEVTYEMIKLAERKGFFRNKKNFKIENTDKTAFALVRPGKKPLTEGLRIIYTHTDSPCLRVKPNPLNTEWDPDKQPLHLGVEMGDIPYGGAVPYHWPGRVCEVRGWINKGERREIKFNVLIPDISMHLEQRDDDTKFPEAFFWEKIKLITGHPSEIKLLEWLGFENRNDFARARLYAVPKTPTIKLPAGDYISGYGHDDSCCTFVAGEAFLEAKPTYTAMFIGFDYEEIGSDGDGGAKSNFFEKILNETIARTLDIELENITNGLVQKIKQNSYAISGDGDAGSSHIEEDLASGVDLKNIGLLGYGAHIIAHDGAWETNQISPVYMDKILRIVNSIDKKKKRYRIIGTPHDADNFEGQGYFSQFLTNRGIPTIDIGLAINGLHSHTETIHGGDLYWTKQAYKAFFEDKEK